MRKWRARLRPEGLAGLEDRPRPGRQRTFAKTAEAEVKAVACALPAETGLTDRLAAFEDRYNATAGPFDWHYTRQSLDRHLDRLTLYEPQAA